MGRGEGHSAEVWFAHVHLQTQMPMAQITAPEYFSDIAELVDRSMLLRVRVDIGKSLMVDQIHSALARGKASSAKTKFAKRFKHY